MLGNLLGLTVFQNIWQTSDNIQFVYNIQICELPKFIVLYIFNASLLYLFNVYYILFNYCLFFSILENCSVWWFTQTMILFTVINRGGSAGGNQVRYKMQTFNFDLHRITEIEFIDLLYYLYPICLCRKFDHLWFINSISTLQSHFAITEAADNYVHTSCCILCCRIVDTSFEHRLILANLSEISRVSRIY